MKTFAVRMVATALFGAVAFTGLGAAPVAARTSGQAEKFAGTYRVHVKWLDQTWSTYRMVLLVNGTGSDEGGNSITWSHVGRQFTYYTFDEERSFSIRGDGVRNQSGFNTRKNPGPFEASFGDSAVWYAVKIPR
jgi:hypothetical protein